MTRLTANVGQYLLLACDGIFDKMTNEQARFVSSRWHTFLSLVLSRICMSSSAISLAQSDIVYPHLFHHDCFLIH